jgi:glycosyltransferase involved in cell wall biosynthesis
MHDWFAAYGADPDRMQIVPNGVSIPRLAPDDLPADDAPPATRGVLRIAFLGSVVRHNGLHVVLDALKEMPDDLRIELTAFGAAGDAGYVREVRSAAASLQHVALRLYGPYEPRQLPLLLDGFDCAVAPSTWPEAFAIVVREALVRGLPVLVSRRGGLPEAVRDGENGFTFDPDRPCELAHQLLRVASEPGSLSRLRRGALASHVLTTSERARRVLDIYRSTQAALSVDRSCRVTRDEVDALHDALVSMGLGD